MKARLSYFILEWQQVKALLKIATPAIFQFIIASCSWIFLAQLVATTGGDYGSAGYQTALRLMMFFMLPAWGMSNAAATLVGQNLGAKELKRAEESVLKVAKYNIIYMAIVTAITFLGADWLVSFFTNDPKTQEVAITALHILATGYILYGIGMVLVSTFNGAGDTWTPTIVNFFGFWLFQIPLAYVLAKHFNMGPKGVFMAIPIAETGIALAGYILFKRGGWKKVKV